RKVVERAKEILSRLQEESKGVGIDLTEAVRKGVQVDEITTYGPEHLPAGPNIDQADALIVVEGRSDVLNLLRCGIKNVIAVEGTSVPQTVKDLSRGKTVTAFTDGDRAGELILREMLQTMDLDFVARAPRGSEVEELTQKQLLKCLRNKIPINQYLEMSGFESTGATREPREERGEGSDRRDDRNSERARRDDRERERDRMPPPPQRAPPPPPPPPPVSAPLPPELQHYFDLLGGVENASRALFIGEDDSVIAEAPIKEMFDALATVPSQTKAVIFDGIVSQRLLDVAQEKGIGTVVATRLGPVGKIPEKLRIYTKADVAGGSGFR
ncbi:MAG: DNA primase DnaG, partial [Thermoplasmata archaeon]